VTYIKFLSQHQGIIFDYNSTTFTTAYDEISFKFLMQCSEMILDNSSFSDRKLEYQKLMEVIAQHLLNDDTIASNEISCMRK